MPTAAKLFAALALALAAAVAAVLVARYLPVASGVIRLGMAGLAVLAAICGAVAGWFILGPIAGQGTLVAVSNGIQAMVVAAGACLFLLACSEMVGRSLRKLYDGPIDAVQDVFRLMIDRGRDFAHPEVIAVLIVGGMLAGMAAEGAARRWR